MSLLHRVRGQPFNQNCLRFCFAIGIPQDGVSSFILIAFCMNVVREKREFLQNAEFSRGRRCQTGCISLPLGMVCSLKVRIKGILYPPTFSFRAIKHHNLQSSALGNLRLQYREWYFIISLGYFWSLKKYTHSHTNTLEWTIIIGKKRPLNPSFSEGSSFHCSRPLEVRDSSLSKNTTSRFWISYNYF